jgi:hypothetical protein
MEQSAAATPLARPELEGFNVRSAASLRIMTGTLESRWYGPCIQAHGVGDTILSRTLPDAY